MTIGRREFVVIAATAAATTAAGCATVKGVEKMYGLIGKMIAVPGQRDALIAILLESIRGTPMPGCKSYVVACDPMDANAHMDHRGLGQRGEPQGIATVACRPERNHSWSAFDTPRFRKSTSDRASRRVRFGPLTCEGSCSRVEQQSKACRLYVEARVSSYPSATPISLPSGRCRYQCAAL